MHKTGQQSGWHTAQHTSKTYFFLSSKYQSTPNSVCSGGKGSGSLMNRQRDKFLGHILPTEFLTPHYKCVYTVRPLLQPLLQCTANVSTYHTVPLSHACTHTPPHEHSSHTSPSYSIQEVGM